MRRTAFVCVLVTLSLIAAIKLDSRTRQITAEAGGHIDFIENQGQWDRGVRFLARLGAATAVVEQRTLTLRPAAHREAAVSLTFEGASTVAVIVGEGKGTTRYNFYLGSDSSAWRANVPAYRAVAYRGMYDGVDVRLHERSGQLEYELRLASGADLEQVVIRADGASNPHLDGDGSLVLDTVNGPFRQSAPRSWEELPDGRLRPLASRFRQIDGQRYGFEVEDRDPTRPLVIDPGLVWSTFLGGSGPDFIGPSVVARDGTGDVFVGGTMASADFPMFSDASFAPGSQVPAFVARLDSTGSALRYATFVGGWHAQIVHRGLAVDAAGNAVLVGQTFSPDFPTTAGVFDRIGVNKDAFVVRLNAAGGLIFSTFLGGSGDDDAYAVAYDPGGSIIVGGTTVSRDFPTTPTAFHPTYNTPNAPADGGAEGDMFIARLTADGTALTYGTFLGGPQADVLEDLVVDANGFVTVCGWVTGNNIQVFVTTPNAFDRTWNGSQDAAIARLKLDGAGAADLKYATLIGGASQDNLWLAAIDPIDPELVTFAGRSWSNNYPVTAGVVRPTNPPFSPLFPDVEAGIITRFRFPAVGSPSLVWSTYHHADRITGLTVNSAGEPIVAGPSAPYDMVTTRGAFDRTADGSGAPGAGFLSRLSADASQYLYQSFFGGSGGIADNFQSVPQVAYVSGNTVIVSGQTTSNDFPITVGAVDPTSSNAIGGGASNEGFVTKVGLDPDASGDLTADPPTLVSPADGATFHNGLIGRLDWNGVTDPSGVEAYEFQVSNRSDFPKAFMLYRGAIPATSVVIPPSVGNSGGLALITFFWRVRTADRAGNLSAWSAARTFTVSPTAGQPTISSIDVDSPSVVGGTQATGMLHLYEPAPAGGLVANLAATHDRSQGLDRTRTLPVPASVPDLVNIPAGALSASFPITTTAVSDAMGLSLIATINGVGGTGTLSVTPTDAGGPTPADVTVLPASLTGGTPATGIVTLNQPAPPGGTAVALSSTHPAIASVPASVTVTAGSRTASFPITTSAPTTEIDVGIAARSGGASWNRPFYVRPLNRLPKLISMTISPSAVTSGNNSGGTLTFSGPIPVGTWPALPDAVVRISSSDPDVAALFPGDDYVVAGSTSHAFRIFTRGVPTTRNVSLTAYFDGMALSGVLSAGAVTGVTVSSLGANVTTLRGGEGGVATVALIAPAPTSLLVTVSTNHPELFTSLPANITVFTGSTTAMFAFVTSKAVTASTPVSLSAAYGASAANLALIVNPPASATPPLISVTLSPTTVNSGTSSTGTATLQSAAPSGGAVVQLFSSAAAASVPASVTVPAGATSATFPVTTTSVSADTAVTITGLLRLSAATTLTVKAPATPPPTPAAPTLLSPAADATPAQPVTFDWTDVTAATTYEIQVDDSSTFAAPLVVDQTVTPSQFTTGGFAGVLHWWRVRGINSAGTAGPWSAAVRFTPMTAPAAPSFSAIALSPTSVVGGNSAQGTATLTSAAPTGGAVVTLSSSNTAVATVSASVTVPVGATSATFNVTTTAVSTSTPVTITGVYGGATKTATLTVTSPLPPASLSAVSVNPTGVVGANASQGTATLTSAAPAGGAVVTLSSSNTAVATVPAGVTVAAGATSATFTITTSAVSASTPVTITGAYGGATKTATLTVTPPASLSAVSVSPTSVTGGTSSQGTVTLTSAAPAGGFGVTLSSNNPAATVPASVTAAAGATSATFAIATTSVTASTVATLTASAAGVTRMAALTVAPPAATATLTVTATGRRGESVTSSPAGINVAVGSTGSAPFTTGTAITLSVSNDRDAIWSGACSSGGNKTKSCTFTLTGAASVTANVQ